MPNSSNALRFAGPFTEGAPRVGWTRGLGYGYIDRSASDLNDLGGRAGERQRRRGWGAGPRRNVHLDVSATSSCTLFISRLNNVNVDARGTTRCTFCRTAVPPPYPAAFDVRRQRRALRERLRGFTRVRSGCPRGGTSARAPAPPEGPLRSAP